MLSDREIEDIRSGIVNKPIQPQWFAGAFARAIEAAVIERCAQISEEVGDRDSDNNAYDAAAAIRGKA